MSLYRSFGSLSRIEEQRRLAVAHHCRLAVETAHPRFRWAENGCSVVLTVNSGYE
jgi:hypothetical protein